MATQLQLRRGTTVENNAFTGGAGELTVDTNTNGLRVHDGSTLGGFQIDTLVAYQLPTSANNYTWYRKYASGYVEQGGETEATTSSVTVALPVEMADDHYTITGMAKGGAKVVSCNTWSTTSITLQYNAVSGSGNAYLCWEVRGFAA